ncbi:hypothetical protein D3C77_684750 [compost metagenome]
MWGLGIQEHGFTRCQFDHVQQQWREQAAVVGIETRDKADGVPRLTLLVVQGGFQHAKRQRFLLTAHPKQAGKQCRQVGGIRLLQEGGDIVMCAGKGL